MALKPSLVPEDRNTRIMMRDLLEDADIEILDIIRTHSKEDVEELFIRLAMSAFDWFVCLSHLEGLLDEDKEAFFDRNLSLYKPHKAVAFIKTQVTASEFEDIVSGSRDMYKILLEELVGF